MFLLVSVVRTLRPRTPFGPSWPVYRPRRNRVSMDDKRIALVTLVTTEAYLDGAAAWCVSAKRTGLTVGVLSTIDVGCSCFDFVFRVDEIRHPNTIGRYETVYTKLHLWAMTSFDRVVYFDVDTLVVDASAIQTLASTPLPTPFAAVQDAFNHESINSGVMVLAPNATVYADLLKTSAETFGSYWTDQEFINDFFGGRTTTLPPRFNVFTVYQREAPETWKFLVPRAAVVHFVAGKPWILFTSGTWPYSAWHDALVEAETKFVGCDRRYRWSARDFVDAIGVYFDWWFRPF